MWRKHAGAIVVAAQLVAATACVPRARPLAGAPAPAALRLPAVRLGQGRERVTFQWRYQEPGFTARGDGAARVAPPDSARLDFFLAGGFGGGWAALVGDQLRTADDDVARRVVPPAPLLWAALGRLAIPAGRDTTLRVSGDTLRADVAAPGASTWRVTLAGGGLTELERLVTGRVVERVTRAGTAIRYEDLANRRTLAIDVQGRQPADAFPAAIWSR